MRFLTLLGCNLKSFEIVELVEQLKADVVYQPDWMDEDCQDGYGVNAIEQGVALVFDENQTLITIYLFPSRSSFDAIDTDVPIFQSSADVTAFADRNDVERSEGQGMVAEKCRRWICLKWSGYSVHYEFIDDKPIFVMLTRS